MLKKRILIGFCHSSTKLAGLNILSATIGWYPAEISGSPGNATACAYKVTNSWYMSSVTWINRGSGGNWNTSGGDYTSKYQSKYVNLPTSVNNGWVKFDVSQTLKSHYSTSTSDPGDKGFLIRTVNNPSAYWKFYSSEYTNAAYRPIMIVQYHATRFGADCGYGWNTANWTNFTRMNNMKTDNMFISRYVINVNQDVDNDCFKNYYLPSVPPKVKIIPIFNSDLEGANSAANYGAIVKNVLSEVASYITSGTITAVELLSESEAPVAFGNTYQGGQSAASYYLAARRYIKSQWPDLELISGGSIENHRQFSRCVNFILDSLKFGCISIWRSSYAAI